jgi:hypothetical protein
MRETQSGTDNTGETYHFLDTLPRKPEPALYFRRFLDRFAKKRTSAHRAIDRPPGDVGRAKRRKSGPTAPFQYAAPAHSVVRSGYGVASPVPAHQRWLIS